MNEAIRLKQRFLLKFDANLTEVNEIQTISAGPNLIEAEAKSNRIQAEFLRSYLDVLRSPTSFSRFAGPPKFFERSGRNFR